MYLDDDGKIIDSLSTYGSLSVGVPGTIDGIFKAHEKFGTISIDTLFNYAIELAFNGFPITQKQARAFNYYQKILENLIQTTIIYTQIIGKKKTLLNNPTLQIR